LKISLYIETVFENRGEISKVWIRKDTKVQNYTSVCGQPEVDIRQQKQK